MKPAIFFIGLGNMGQPMAANLCRAGYPLMVHDLDASKAQPLFELGRHGASHGGDLFVAGATPGRIGALG